MRGFMLCDYDFCKKFPKEFLHMPHESLRIIKIALLLLIPFDDDTQKRNSGVLPLFFRNPNYPMVRALNKRYVADLLREACAVKMRFVVLEKEVFYVLFNVVFRSRRKERVV